jgi:hypothetical protein
MPKVLWILTVAVLAVPAFGEAITITVDPRQTFLRTDTSDFPTVTGGFLTLPGLGLLPGDEILLERLGDFSHGTSFPDTGTTLLGLFSSSNLILSSTSGQFRVPGAIDAGIDVMTGPTFFEGLATDIPQDFFIGVGTTITIPTGAQALFIGVFDSFYSDNTDPDRDFGVRLTAVPTAVPEPGSLFLLGTGGLALARTIRRRRSCYDTAACPRQDPPNT